MKFTITHACGHTTEHRQHREQTLEMVAAFQERERLGLCLWCRKRRQRAQLRLRRKLSERIELYYSLEMVALAHAYFGEG